MKGAMAKRGTHGLRKRCPKCRKLKKFYGVGDKRTRDRHWIKMGSRWWCMECAERAEQELSVEFTTLLLDAWAR